MYVKRNNFDNWKRTHTTLHFHLLLARSFLKVSLEKQEMFENYILLPPVPNSKGLHEYNEFSILELQPAYQVL